MGGELIIRTWNCDRMQKGPKSSPPPALASGPGKHGEPNSSLAPTRVTENTMDLNPRPRPHLQMAQESKRSRTPHPHLHLCSENKSNRTQECRKCNTCHTFEAESSPRPPLQPPLRSPSRIRNWHPCHNYRLTRTRNHLYETQSGVPKTQPLPPFGG